MKKSKAIFFLLSIIAVFFLMMFSFAIGAANIPWMIITFILFCATMGYGFTLKKKYKRNNWL